MSTRSPAGGTLYVVATPIGNLEDLTPRARRILSEVDLIACEDTRHTGHLLAAHSIRKPMVSCFEHNEERRIPELISRLEAGEKIALVSDAGTPAISDPGYRLVRAALDAGYRVVSLPGPSAPIAALSIAGIPTDRFVFEGFLPARAGARRTALESLHRERRTMVFLEAPHRLVDTLAAMAQAFGASREAAVVREITKTFEETARGTLGELGERFREVPARGEITLVVAGAPASDAGATGSGVGELTVEILIDAGLGLKQASELIAKLTGRSRREIYQQGLKTRGRDS